MNLDYTATDEQLLAMGVAQRIIDLAKQPFLRKGGVDFDCKYALAVWDARDKVSLYALALNNPNEKHVWFPPGKFENATIGLIR